MEDRNIFDKFQLLKSKNLTKIKQNILIEDDLKLKRHSIFKTEKKKLKEYKNLNKKDQCLEI